VGDDNVQLSDREREALAQLAEQIGDPWLARQLAGQAGGGADDAPSSQQARRVHAAVLRRINAAAAPLWVAILMVGAGAVLTVATFAHSVPAACLGLILMGAGVWRLVVDHSGVIARRLNEQRARVPVSSSPPRTPPAMP
jgi:hypothetical protein